MACFPPVVVAKQKLRAGLLWIFKVDLKSGSRSSLALSFPHSLKKSLVYCSRNIRTRVHFAVGIFCLFVFLLETLAQQFGVRISPIGRSAGLTVNVVLFESLVLQRMKLLSSILVIFSQSLILFTNFSEFEVDSCQLFPVFK